MEEKRIDIVKNGSELKFIHDIQVFLGFANFYFCFIQRFGRIAVPLTSMLMMSPASTSATQKLMNLIVEFDGDNCGKNKARKTSASTKGSTRADYLSFNYDSHAVSNFVSNSAKNVSNYLTPDTKKAFDQFCQAFTKALILQHFDLEQYIQVETNASEYAIGKVLNQLTNNLDR